ncbi:hypothetical protein Tco_0802405 [Tanacetum coccineum]|uniref:Reverse transcriptase domain-containing protein n=1 Tax=Tanacetum coccineum TaxID=301880 RepID=A0ABQ5A2C4_9ASTR
MHTRASNSELVEHLEEPERTLNLHVPMANPDDDEPMWAADHVVAPTLSLKITIPATANEFAIKEDHSTLIKGNQFDAFADEGNSNSDIDKIMARMDAMTMKMDAQYKEIKSRTECNHCGGNHSTADCNNDNTSMSHEKEAKFMQTFRRTCFYNDYREHDSNRDNWRSSGRNDYNRDYYRSNTDDKPDNQKQSSDFIKSQRSINAFVKETFMDLKTKLETTTKNHQALIQNLKAKFDRLANKQSARPSGSLPRNTQPNPRGNSSKPYQPPQSRNEQVNSIFTRSGRSYDPPTNPNNPQNGSETHINFDSDDENEETKSTPQPQTPKPKEAPTPKPNKPRIPYPQRLRKEKMEPQY